MKKILGHYKEIPRDVKLAIWAISISWFFWGPADGYYSLYLKQFGSDYAQIGWLVSLQHLIPLLVTIPFGILSDKFSARKIVILSLALYIAIPPLYFYAGSYGSLAILVGTILFNALTNPMRNIAMDTYIKEQSPREVSGKVWAFYEALTNGFWGLGLVFGGIMVLFLTFSELNLLALPGIFAMLWIFYTLSEPQKTFHKEYPHVHQLPLRKRIARGWHHLLHIDRRVFYLLLLTLFSAITLGNMTVFLALFANELNFGLPAIGILLGIMNAANFLAVPLNKLTKRLGKFWSMAVGKLIMCVMMLLVIFLSQAAWWILFVVLFLHQAAFLLVKPVRNSIIAAFTPKDMQGEMSGIQMFTISLGNFIGAILFGYIGHFWGLREVFIVTFAIYLGMFLCFWKLALKYEHTVAQVEVHPHSSLLSMLHIGHLGHSLPPPEMTEKLVVKKK